MIDRLLDRAAQPGVVLRVAALSVCLLELAAAVAGLLGFRTDAYDGAVAVVYLRLGGAPNDRALLLICLALVLVFAWQYWQLARDGSADQPRGFGMDTVPDINTVEPGDGSTMISSVQSPGYGRVMLPL